MIIGVLGETISVADISNCPRLAVASCVAVMIVEPTPTIVTIRPSNVATLVLLLVNVKPTVLSVLSGSVKLNDTSP